MENFLRALVLVPVIVALTQWVKWFLPESFAKFLWIFSCGLWVLAAYGYVEALAITEYNTTMIVMAWIIAGLSASGLYEVWNNIVKTVKR